MQISWSNTSIHQLTTSALIIPLVSDIALSRLRGFDPRLVEAINKLNANQDWRGDKGEVAVFYPATVTDRLPGITRIILVGMGSSNGWNYESMRQAVGAGIQAVKKHRLADAVVLLPEGTSPATSRDLATVVALAAYDFRYYKTQDSTKDHPSLDRIELCSPGETSTAGHTAAVAAGQVVGQATNFVRDLTNHPANAMTPKHLARDAKELAGDNLTVEVFGRSELQKMKMGALLSVAKGSVEEPQLIVAQYQPKLAKKAPLVALVGKGITFDSGGISIKPSDGMEEMKMDMAGAATALGVVAAAKALSLPIRLVAVLPVTENLPSGSATKPGDIITARNGMTIEVLNTDAEGRVVLADGLSYAAQEFAPDAIIDLATLTGAAIVALGHEAAPIMGNNASLITAIKEAADRTGERVWELPLWDEYKEQVKSEIADVKNLGEGRTAGVIAGGAFLSYFVPETIPWVHIDVAGTAMMDKARRSYMPKGGSGWGVRLLVDLLEHWR